MYQESINNLLYNVKIYQNELVSIMQRIESHCTALDEYKCVVECLENANREKDFWHNNVERFAYFMPINQPFYSLILSLLASLAAKVTYVRPATDTSNIVIELAEKIDLQDLFPNFHIVISEREKFLEDYVEEADAVYFVGEYKNAKKVQKRIKSNALFLYSGTGMNPFVVTKNADIILAAEKAIQAGLYNSGQDCGRPKVYIIHESRVEEFLQEMERLLENVVCDDYSNNETLVGSLLRDNIFQNVVENLLKNRSSIKYGGRADMVYRVIYPTILKVDINQNVIYQEFFAPVFTVATYKEEKELELYFKDNRYYENAMYISLFGDLSQDINIDSRSVIKNQNILDIEQGNTPFGGYGKKANYIWNGSKMEAHPFLISEELYKFGCGRKKVTS